MDTSTHSLTTDAQSPETTFSLLSNQRRCDVVSVLSKQESSLPVDDLARAVAGREIEGESSDVTADVIREIAITLHHVHLPKLDDANIIDYDPATTIVAPVQPEKLTPLLELSNDGVK